MSDSDYIPSYVHCVMTESPIGQWVRKETALGIIGEKKERIRRAVEFANWLYEHAELDHDRWVDLIHLLEGPFERNPDGQHA